VTRRALIKRVPLRGRRGSTPLPRAHNNVIDMGFRQLHCYRCGWDWGTRKDQDPVHCPHCNSPYWHTEKGIIPMGRPNKDGSVPATRV